MAVFTRYVLSITLVDGVDRDTVISYYIKPAEAKLYFAAADYTARQATAIGVLVDAVTSMTLGSRKQVSVSIEDLQDPLVLPSDDVLRGNKISVSYRAGGRGLTATLPTRDPSSYVQEAGSLIIDPVGTSATGTFIAEFNGHVVDQFGNDSTIVEMKVVD